MYSAKTFSLPELRGLSSESVEAHLGLYAGYVKNFNALSEMQATLMKDPSTNTTSLAEITRRLPFEFNGVRLHELYFSQWEGGTTPLRTDSPLSLALAKHYGSTEDWQKQFRAVGAMRGIGWALLVYDSEADAFHTIFVEQHHQGHFATLPVILALDVWEHAYVAQYGTTGRGAYIDACFTNYNWSVMERRFEAARI